MAKVHIVDNARMPVETTGGKPVYLIKLIQNGHCVSVVAVDKGGNRIRRGYLITFSPQGVYLHERISPEIGLPTDDEGRLIVETSY